MKTSKFCLLLRRVNYIRCNLTRHFHAQLLQLYLRRNDLVVSSSTYDSLIFLPLNGMTLPNEINVTPKRIIPRSLGAI